MDNTLGLCEPTVWICLALQLSNDTHSAQVDSFLRFFSYYMQALCNNYIF